MRAKLHTAPHRRVEHQEECHVAREGGEAPESKEDKEREETERDRAGETPQGAPVEVTCIGGDVPPPEENADLPGFQPEREHLLLQGVY